MISLGELDEWCQAHRDIPDDEDDTYISSQIIQYGDEYEDEEDLEPMFRFFLTTKRLLRHATNARIICADATYKLNWQGYPVLIVGTIDRDKQFHPIGLSVCMTERQEDFEFVFSRYVVHEFVSSLMIISINWLTFIYSINTGLGQLDLPPATPRILIADAAAAITNGFEWILSNSGWYEGVEIYSPSSNNALVNNVIKNHFFAQVFQFIFFMN